MTVAKSPFTASAREDPDMQDLQQMAARTGKARFLMNKMQVDSQPHQSMLARLIIWLVFLTILLYAGVLGMRVMNWLLAEQAPSTSPKRQPFFGDNLGGDKRPGRSSKTSVSARSLDRDSLGQDNEGQVLKDRRSNARSQREARRARSQSRVRRVRPTYSTI